MVAANLIVIISIVALCNASFSGASNTSEHPTSQSHRFRLHFLPRVAFLMGVPRNELYLVGQLIGMKTIQNEFVAFAALTAQPEFEACPRARHHYHNVCDLRLCQQIDDWYCTRNLRTASPKRRGDVAREALSHVFVCIGDIRERKLGWHVFSG